MTSFQTKNEKGEKKSAESLYLAIALPLAALLSSLILLPIEKILPYPYIIEEGIKAVFVLLILTIPGKRTFQLQLSILIGLFFAFSENIFYLSNSNLYASPLIFIERLLLTSTLHVFTILLMLFFSQKYRWIFPFALSLAILIHYTYNRTIASLLY
jgi:hypothetical protein